ncbi:MAG: SUF system Fe-S cluster assembly regulator [Alphaproteobacteria bacterium]
MIKFSKLTDYAVVILTTLQNSDEALLSASTLSQRTSLPEPTVSKALKLLAKGSIITSLRGANGGYSLARTSKEITVYEIACAMEGDIALAACVDDHDGCCDIADSCALNGRWNSVNNAVKDALQSVTLYDMTPPNPFLTDADFEEMPL